MTDITERRRAEEALPESQHLLELSFAQSRDGLFFMLLDEPLRWDLTVDKDAALEYVLAHERITKVNQALLAQYGARAEQLIGQTPGTLFAHDLPYASKTWRKLFDAGRLQIEADERKMDGTPIRIEGDYICLYDSQKRVLGHLGIQRDITQRKEAEEKARRSRRELRDLAARLQLVREEERTRIAREIHDELGQALTGLKIDLAWLRRRVDQSPELAERMQSVVVRIDGTIDSVRRIATELRPSVLDHLGLVAAVEWQAQEFERRTGIRTALEVQSAHPEIDDTRATTVFRILQETLTNVARHAQATQVGIALIITAVDLALDIRDNGRGITPAEIADPRSLGLVGLRERAIACGGALAIRGAPETGTHVSVRIPLVGTPIPLGAR